MTGGVALFDMDADGDLDLYMVQSGPLVEAERAGDLPGNRLYENIGGGQYEDVTEGSGADDDGYGVGVAVGITTVTVGSISTSPTGRTCCFATRRRLRGCESSQWGG